MKPALLCLLLTSSSFAADFHFDLGVYFGVPQSEVVALRERHIPDQELPVVLVAARQARVAPEVIVKMRLGGRSWTDIAFHYGLGPEVFFLPVRSGPRYGKAYGYWKRHPCRDEEFVEAVNVRFLSDHYRVPRTDIDEYHGHGMGYVQIHNQLERERAGGHGKGDDHLPPGQSKEKRGKGRGHNQE